MRRLMCLITFVLLLSLANSALAVEFRWIGGTSNDWMDGDNWIHFIDPDWLGGVVPDTVTWINEDGEEVSSDTVVTIQSGYGDVVVDPNEGWPILLDDAPDIKEIRIGFEGIGSVYGEFNINGGSLVMDGDLRMGYEENNIPYALGVLNMNGGVFSIGDDIRVGRYGAAVINMSGGLFVSTDRQEALELANNSVDSSVIIDLSGGLIDVHSLQIGSGTVDIIVSATGVMRLDGDCVEQLEGLIDDGVIHSRGGGDKGITIEFVEGDPHDYTFLSSTPSVINPIPADGSRVSPGATQLEWTLPDPNLPEGVVTCDVYFSSDPNELSKSRIVENKEIETTPVTLEPDTVYYCRIDVYDSDLGTEPYFVSRIFRFDTKNKAPAVNPGDDVDTWLVGDSRVVQLDGSVSDTDGGPGPTWTDWSVIEEPDPDTNPAAISDSAILNPTITITEPGSYTLRLRACDGNNTTTETIQIVLYADPCEHAQSQEGYVTLPGDVDNDCDVDMTDLAKVAASLFMENYSTE